jgi:hypothetical protein
MDTSIDFFKIRVSIVISGYNSWFQLKKGIIAVICELSYSNIFMFWI